MFLLRLEAQGHDQVPGLGSFPWGAKQRPSPETSSLTGQGASAGPLWVRQTACVLLRCPVFLTGSIRSRVSVLCTVSRFSVRVIRDPLPSLCDPLPIQFPQSQQLVSPDAAWGCHFRGPTAQV